MKTPELSGNQMMTIAYLIGMVIVLVFVYKLMQKLGLIKSKESKAKKEATDELRQVEQFDPLYLSGKSGYVPLNKAGKQYALDIHNALKGIGTNEESIFIVFNKFKSKNNISEVALYYKTLYNKEMLVDILNELTAAEKLTLNNIIKKLP